LKRVILCADDYGQKDSISQAVVSLVCKNRLSAVSCMVTQPHWQEHGRALLPHTGKVDVGLHFNLTHGTGVSVGKLLLKSMLRLTDPKWVQAECLAQMDAFTAVMGGLPDFIDGHQHIQHFPVVREVLLGVCRDRLAESGCYVRAIHDPDFWQRKGVRFKRLVLALSGTSAFKKRLVAENIPHNASFSGIYPFDRAEGYGKYFQGFLEEITDGGLILCHPGERDGDVGDPLAASRPQELAFLSGPDFPEQCARMGVRLSRFRETARESYPVA